MPMNVLEVHDVSAGYKGTLALDKINFSVEEGDLLGIVGPNGAGKTTLFRAILGLQNYEGSIKLFGCEGKQYYALLPMVGYVPQRVNFERNFPATASDVVAMGMLSERGLKKRMHILRASGCNLDRIHTPSRTGTEKVEEALKIVGLESFKDRRIGELSGGEQQRAFIAKALVNEPLLLILDEPVTGIDVEIQNKFYSMLDKINKENGITIVWSSHDLTAISRLANKVACINRNLFFHGEKTEFFTNKDLLKTYAESAMQLHMHNHNM
jgi:zinc transport system ATP-binding protein